jgi:hypothetical protein
LYASPVGVRTCIFQKTIPPSLFSKKGSVQVSEACAFALIHAGIEPATSKS